MVIKFEFNNASEEERKLIYKMFKEIEDLGDKVEKAVEDESKEAPKEETVNIPVKTIETKYERSQFAEAMGKAIDTKGIECIQGILKQLGVETLTQVPEERFCELAKLLNERGVEI